MTQVSVIIPCYNQGRFIDETVASVLAQTFADYEIIIINDGSSDSETNGILRDYRMPKTRVIHTDNQGLAAARNNGIRAAEGDYILPLDADDRIGPSYLEEAVNILDRPGDIGIVYCRARLFGAVETEWELPDFSHRQMMFDNVIFCSAFFRKTDWDLVGGYDTDLIYGWEDYDFWLSLLELGRRVYCIPKHLFYYRVSADSMVRARPRQHKLETFTRIYKKHPQFFSENIEIWIDTLLDTGGKYYEARIIPDNLGGGECDARFIRKIDCTTRRLQFALDHLSAGRVVFQPAGFFSVVTIKKISLVTGEEETHELDWISNASLIEGEICFFGLLPPAVEFELPGDLAEKMLPEGKLVIDLQYHCLGDECAVYMLELYKNKVGSKGEPFRSSEMVVEPSCGKKIAGIKAVEVFSRMSRLGRFFLSHQNFQNYQDVSQTDLFDSSFYLKEYKDLNYFFKKFPLIHYMVFGWREGRRPNAFFDLSFYLEDNPGVARPPVNQLLHYINHGAGEGRSPNRFFDPVYYSSRHGLNDQPNWKSFEQFITRGAVEDYRPDPLFDPHFYREQYPDYGATESYPLLHYQKKGVFEGRYPCKEVAELGIKPLISIITPVYNTDELLLRKCIHSVLYQAYPHWQLCLVDDGSGEDHVRRVLEEYAALDSRIKVSFLENNRGISTASNEAVALATGDYVSFLDHDDELTRDALYEVVRVINAENPDIIYSDEDLVNLESRYLESFHKPDYNAELLLCHNYITHFLVTKRSLFVETGGFSDQFSGAQDYDLFLKLTEKSRKTVHIPKILYHWRAHETSTSVNHQQKLYADEAGRKALAEALVRRKIDGTAERTELKFFYRVQRKSAGRPKISLISGTPGDDEFFPSRVKKIVEFTDYADIEFILPGQSEEGSSLVWTLSKVDAEIHLVNFPADMTEVQWKNRAAEAAGGEVLLFFDLSQQPEEGDVA